MESIRPYRGFTLVELVVVLAIITIITGVALTSQGSFNKTYILSNAAYDIALTVRSAENFGLGSRAVGTTVNAGYGLHFQKGVTGSFGLFADTYPTNGCTTVEPNCTAGNYIYTSGSPGDTLVQTYALNNRITISNFCARTSGTWSCAQTNGASLSSLDIVFQRPNPNANLSTNGTYSANTDLACITLTSPQGNFKYITIGATGQIIANAASCP